MKRLLPAVVFFVVTLLGAGITWIVYQAIRDTAESEFQSLADNAVDRVTRRIEQHLSLLTATHALLEANGGEVDAASFATFVSGLRIEDRYDGIQGIGFAELIPAGEEPDMEARLESAYEIPRKVWPAATGEQYRTPIVLLEPRDPRNDTALGYDMFSESTRREAMLRAMETGVATASGAVELVQEITSVKQVGFLVYLPFRAGGDDAAGAVPDGFVYAPFRAGDLHAAALEKPPILPVVVKTYDISGESPVRMYQSPAFDQLRSSSGMTTAIDADIAGRKWRFEVHSTGGVAQYADFLPVYVLSAVLIVLAASLAAGARWQHKAVESAVALHDTTRRSLEEKELLVQEMRHRIKNSITRMMAIARQTASSSDNLDDFTTSFTARMNAMAKAQDLLARSHWGRAKIADLLKAELDQVFGDRTEQSLVGGPEINLNERATQAFGLVFHEMATNALKYSGVADGDAELSISWRYEGKGSKRVLVLVWSEKGNVIAGEPEGKGFGSRLVEASIRGELGGEVERDFAADGMTVTFTIPAKAIN